MKKLAIVILWVLAPFTVHAQEIFPNKPIKVIIPFPAGGPSDTIGRIYANQLRLALNGAAVIIENKPGAGGAGAAADVWDGLKEFISPRADPNVVVFERNHSTAGRVVCVFNMVRVSFV